MSCSLQILSVLETKADALTSFSTALHRLSAQVKMQHNGNHSVLPPQCQTTRTTFEWKVKLVPSSSSLLCPLSLAVTFGIHYWAWCHAHTKLSKQLAFSTCPDAAPPALQAGTTNRKCQQVLLKTTGELWEYGEHKLHEKQCSEEDVHRGGLITFPLPAGLWEGFLFSFFFLLSHLFIFLSSIEFTFIFNIILCQWLCTLQLQHCILCVNVFQYHLCFIHPLPISVCPTAIASAVLHKFKWVLACKLISGPLWWQHKALWSGERVFEVRC